MLGMAVAPRGLVGEDVEQVRDAAALLQLPEFRFFHLAHHHWFGCHATDGEIEPYFMGYLLQERVPVWVRHLARDVIARDDFPDLEAANSARPSACLTEALPLLLYGICFALVTLCTL